MHNPLKRLMAVALVPATLFCLWVIEPAPQGHTVFRAERDVCAHGAFLSERGVGHESCPRRS
jgi:hypothetical protein